jgi:hypothetical protein
MRVPPSLVERKVGAKGISLTAQNRLDVPHSNEGGDGPTVDLVAVVPIGTVIDDPFQRLADATSEIEVRVRFEESEGQVLEQERIGEFDV